MWELKAVDIQLIAKWMQITNLERELRENRERWTWKELSEWARKMKQQLLKSFQKQYKRMIKKNNKFDEYGYYLEKQAEMHREDQILSNNYQDND